MKIGNARHARLAMRSKRHFSRVLTFALLISLIGVPVTLIPARADTSGSGICQQTFTKSGTGQVDVVESGGYCFVAFKNTGSIETQTTFIWTRPTDVLTADVLVVGGGGGGGARHGGGGGAGAYVENTGFDISSATSISIVVGAGGGGANGSTTYTGNSGATSSFKLNSFGLVANGGGAGTSGAASATTGSSSGGSGSGQTSGSVTAQTQTKFDGSSITGITFGNVGMGGANESNVGVDERYDYWAGGGGGGAGSAGARPTNNGSAVTTFPSGTWATARGGNGGNGKVVSWLSSTIATTLSVGQVSGSDVYFAGGGGGGIGNDGLAGGTGGLGGGANGTRSEASPTGASSFTGGGGGGGGFDDIYPATGFVTNGPGSNGGSGIVVVRFARTQSALTITSTAAKSGTPLTLTTSGGSGSGAVSFSVTSAGTANCSISGSTLSATSAGTCTVTATKAAADGYLAISSIATTIRIALSQTIDYAINFDGSSSKYASVSSQIIPNSSPFTAEAWFKSNDTVSYRKIFSQGDLGAGTGQRQWDNSFYVEQNSGKIRVVQFAATAYVLDCGTYSTNSWTHVAVVYNNPGLSCYINGFLTGSDNTKTLISTTAKFMVGNFSPDPTAASCAWNGSIDEVRVYNIARSQSQIQTDLKTYGPVAEANLIAYFDFNEGSGSSASNQKAGASSATNLTLTGNPTWSDVGQSVVSNGKTYVAFPRSYLNNSGGWTVPENVSNASVLVVAGGGGGGSRAGGGGGAGGLIQNTNQSVTAGSVIALTVGPGGAGAPSTRSAGKNGYDSTLGISGSTLQAIGGGGGADPGLGTATSGGSGGGGTGTTYSPGTGTSGQGFSGGIGLQGNCASQWCGGGGGGAGGAGGNATGSTSGAGGVGVLVSWIPKSVADTASIGDRSNGASVYFAGGGSGGGGSGTTAGAAGLGGGAIGVTGTSVTAPNAATPATGGGGGGGGYELIAGGQSPAGSGGSGVIVFSFTSSYLISYLPGEGGYGSAPSSPISVGLNSSFTTPSNTFTRTGFTFAGWSDGSNTFAENVRYPTSGQVTQNVTLTATWTPNSNVVTYNSNGGSSVSSGSFTSGGSIASAPVPPTRNGFTFAGWSTTLGGSQISFPYTPATNTDITLYALWTRSSQSADYAITFNGTTSNYANNVDQVIPATGDFTVEAWFKAETGAPSYAVLLSQGSSSTAEFFIQRDSTNGMYFKRSGGSDVSCGNFNGYNTWNHIAVSFSGNTASCFLNGALTKSVSGQTWTPIGSNFTTGGRSAGLSTSTTPWKGAIDEVRVYNSSRTLGQINADLKTHGPVNGSDLVAYFDFNEGSGSTLNNLVPSSNSSSNLTIAGSPSWNDVATTSTSGNKTIVTFERSYLNNSGGWPTPANVSSAQVLVVAGGGGGGDSNSAGNATGGGGGAGGYFTNSAVPLSGTISIGVGVGGAGALTTSSRAGNGGDSWLGTLKVGGGGGGNSYGYTTALAASAGNGGSDYVVGGNGGGGRSKQNTSNASMNGGSAGVYALSGISFGGTTFTGSAGGAGGSGGGDFGSGGLGGSISAINRTSSISGTSIEYAKRSDYRPWGHASNSQGTKTFGSGGSTNYMYGSAESDPNIYGGDGAQGVVIVSWQSTFNVTYNSKGGSSVPAGTFALGGSIANAPTDPTRTSYTFVGWSATDGGTQINFPYTPGVSADITLYALWTSNSVSVTYANGGGSGNGPTSPVSGLIGSTITLPLNTFTRTGFSFAGWSDGSTTYSAGSTYPSSGTITGNISLTAVWSANNNTVTFNSNYGVSPSTSTQTIVSGISTALTSSPFNRTGYTFAGWNTLASGGGTAYLNSANITLYADLTLYAQWSEVTYTVTFDSNSATSGSPELTSSIYKYTTGALTLPTAGSLIKTGHRFDGWAESVGGNKISGSYTPSTNKTLYARWIAETYTVTYFSNDGGTAPSPDTYTYGNPALTLPAQGSMAKTGYMFNGWSTEINNGSKKIANSQTSATFTPTASTYLYALWTPVNYNVTYTSTNASSGAAPTDLANYNIGKNAVVKANTGSLIRTGYSFGGWTIDGDNSGTVYQSGQTYTFSAGNVTFNPKWNANTYTITYNANGATSGELARTTDTYITGGATVSLPNPGTMTRTGYTFKGWATRADGTALTGTAATEFTTVSNVTLYAIWELKSISYSYNLGSAGGSSVDTNLMNLWPNPLTGTSIYNSDINLSSRIDSRYVNQTGTFDFFGWRDSVNSVTYDTGSAYKIQSETAIEFTAQWVQVFSVHYALNGGTNATNNYGVDYQCLGSGYTCTVNQSITLNEAPTRLGYTFSGWKDQSGTVYNAGGLATVTDSSYLFYAQWTAKNYYLDFNSVGGVTIDRVTGKNIGDLYVLPDPGVKAGYDFAGWSVGGVIYGAGTYFNVQPADNNVLGFAFTAQWTPKSYTVSYNWNGGVGSATSPSSYTVGQGGISLPSDSNHTRDGYVFDGWSETDGGTKLNAPYTPTNDKLLYARWLDGNYTITYETVGGTQSQVFSSVPRGTSLTLPTPTRSGFTFAGWYQDQSNTLIYGDSQNPVTPTGTVTVYAKWIQNSLYDIEPAHLNELASVTVQSGSESNMGATHTASGTGASVVIPADALPSGTVVKLSFVEDLTRPKELINVNYAYYTSAVLHWLSGSGSSATVPTAAVGKPLVLTLTNPDIRTGAKIYKIVSGVATEVATATQDGQVSIQIYEDPEIVVAATTPTAPQSVTAIGNLNAKSTVSWNSPTSTGGSAITSYRVQASPGNASCTTTSNSCDVSGLTNDTSYTFTVKAINAVGESVASTSSNSVIPRLFPTFTASFDSKGGSTIDGTLFNNTDGIDEPTAPTRAGYTFGGWLAQDGVVSSKVTFPYTPNLNSDITLFAHWIANAISNPLPENNASAGGNLTANNPISSVNTGNESTNASNGITKPLINIPEKPSLYSPPQTQFSELKNAPYPTNGLNVPMVGEVITLINRQPTAVKVTATEVNTLIEIGNSISMTLTSKSNEGDPIAPSASGAISVVKGAFVDATGVGFKPGSPIEAWLFSKPIRLGDGVASTDGTFENKFSIGNNIPLGKHTIVLNGISNKDELVTVALGVQVLDKAPVTPNVSPEIVKTPSPLTQVLESISAGLFIAILLGLLLLALRRRRA